MKRLLLIPIMMTVSLPAWAKPAPELVKAIQDAFPSAEQNRSLVSSQVNLDMSKVRGFAVVKQSGIPAGQAYWFITRQDYEYRPLIVEDHKVKTYFGKVEVTLDPGTIMVVSDAEVFRHTVQLKLLSKDVIPEKGEDKPNRRDTRAATSLTFKFPELPLSAADASTILNKIKEFVVPADSLEQAEQVAAQIRGGMPVTKAIQLPPSVGMGRRTGGGPASMTPVVSPVKAAPVVTGMSFDDVKRIQGEPKHVTTHGNDVIFDYGNHEIIFQHAKVQDIRWK